MPLTYYLYHFQQSRRIPMMLQFRVNGETADYAAAIQRLVREVAPQAQLISVRRMSDVVDESLVQERFIAQTASAFSLFGLLLACVGLYGVMSYTVTQRTNEIGIRMALGAERRHVVRLVMREVGLLMALGIGAGLGVALAVTRLATLFTLLFDLAPTDPATIALATLLLAGVAALAGYLPARRASRVDPLVALRYE